MASPQQQSTSVCPSGHVIIAGFGLPGREVANILHKRNVAFCVIELNRATVERCQIAGLQIIEGDAADAQTLTRANLQSASLLVISIPNETVTLDTIRAARSLNKTVRIIARCHYTSTGMIARQAGADEVIVAEQVVAEEFKGRVWERLDALSEPH